MKKRTDEFGVHRRPSVLSLKEYVLVFFVYYIRGRVFEWTMAVSTFFAGLELLIWNNILTFGAFHWLLTILSQKWIGSIMFFLGWLRISGLMFNGQLLFGQRFGWFVRAISAVISASIWFQFSMALWELSIQQGYPSIGLPFWSMFVVAELIITYQIGAQWKK